MITYFSQCIATIWHYIYCMYANMCVAYLHVAYLHVAYLRTYNTTHPPSTPSTFLDMPADIREYIIACLVRSDIPSALTLMSTCHKMHADVRTFIQLPGHLSAVSPTMYARSLLCARKAGIPLAQFPITMTGQIMYLDELGRSLGLISESPEFAQRIRCISTTFAAESRRPIYNIVVCIGNIDIDHVIGMHIYISPTCVSTHCTVGDRVCVSGTLYARPSSNYTDTRIRFIEYYVNTIQVVG